MHFVLRVQKLELIQVCQQLEFWPPILKRAHYFPITLGAVCDTFRWPFIYTVLLNQDTLFLCCLRALYIATFLKVHFSSKLALFKKFRTSNLNQEIISISLQTAIRMTLFTVLTRTGRSCCEVHYQFFTSCTGSVHFLWIDCLALILILCRRSTVV